MASPICLALLFGIGCTKPNPDVIVATTDEFNETSSGPSTEPSETTHLGESSESGSQEETGDVSDLPTGDAACEVASSVAGACGDCLEAMCCDELVACDAETGCMCLSDCLIGGDTELACMLECVGGLLSAPALLSLQSCTDMACGDAC